MSQAVYTTLSKFRFLILPVVFVALLWFIHLVEVLFQPNLARFSVEPHTADGLLGIFFFPLLHGDWGHLIGNTSSILVLLASLRYIFPQLFLRVFLWSYLAPGVFIWFFGRSAFHIGASALVYSLVAFLFISGVIRVNRHLLAFSLFVVFLYGGLFWGIFPIEQGISWEGHLGGGITGFLLAVYYKKEQPVKEVIEQEPNWDDDDEFDPEGLNVKEEIIHPKEEISPEIKYIYRTNSGDDDKN